jgi:predicted kinase
MKQKPKPIIVLMIGAPASTKSTESKLLFIELQKLYKDNVKLISVDEHIRFKILDSKNTGIYFDPKKENEVYDTLEKKVIKNIKKGKSLIIDNTNMSKERRHLVLQHVPRDKYKIKFIYLKCNINLLLYRNKRRNRFVPEHAIFRKIGLFDFPTHDECDHIAIREILPTPHEYKEIIKIVQKELDPTKIPELTIASNKKKMF